LMNLRDKPGEQAGNILLAHGSGGETGHRLVTELFVRHFDNECLAKLDDSAVLTPPSTSGARLAFTTDSYVVKPIFFPGGDIGKLAVCGTVNDLAVMGARPLYLSAGFLIEEGFPLPDLERVVRSMAETRETLKWSSGEELTACSSTRRAWGWFRRGFTCQDRSYSPAMPSCSAGPSGTMVWRS
jgi:hypothetical protein